MAKRKKFMLSAFSIIFILIIILAIFSHILPDAQFVDGILVDGSGTVGAKLSDFLLSPILGFSDAVDVCVFILILGGFLAIINKTGALETGIKVLVKKLKGNEIVLIPILMFIFSVGGTTYGMLEETVGFYVLLAATMVAAGYDTIVGSAIVLLGAGSGVLGSTVNPFAVGVAVSSLPEGVTANQGLLIFTGLILWITTLLISIIFVMNYAKKVQEDKGSTFLSLQEQKAMEKKFIKEEDSKDKKKDVKLSIKQRITLILLGLTFVVMIIGFIPWGDFNVTIFDKFTGWLTGTSLGGWYFAEASVWFFVMAIIIGIINRFKEKEIVDFG